MVADAADYPWSSYNARIGLVPDSDWLVVDACFSILGDTTLKRRENYKVFVKQSVSSDETRIIREALQRGLLTGTARFIEEVERIAGVRIERRGQGRPRLDGGK